MACFFQDIKSKLIAEYGSNLDKYLIFVIATRHNNSCAKLSYKLSQTKRFYLYQFFLKPMEKAFFLLEKQLENFV